MTDFRESFEHGLRSQSVTVGDHLAAAIGTTVSAGALLAGTVIAARRFNEDKSRTPALLTAVLLGGRTVAATVEAGFSIQDLAQATHGALLGRALFGSQETKR